MTEKIGVPGLLQLFVALINLFMHKIINLNNKNHILIIVGVILVVLLISLSMFSSDPTPEVSTTAPTITKPASSEVAPTLEQVRAQKEFGIFEYNKNSYMITILKAPFEENRLIAERAFLDTYRLTEEEACKLRVYINTPFRVDAELSGKTFPLSSCTQ